MFIHIAVRIKSNRLSVLLIQNASFLAADHSVRLSGEKCGKLQPRRRSTTDGVENASDALRTHRVVCQR